MGIFKKFISKCNSFFGENEISRGNDKKVEFLSFHKSAPKKFSPIFFSLKNANCPENRGQIDPESTDRAVAHVKISKKKSIGFHLLMS